MNLNSLPLRAKQKLQQLRGEREDAEGLYAAVQASLARNRRNIEEIEFVFGAMHPQHPERVAAEVGLQDLQSEIEKLLAVKATREATRSARMQIHERVKDWAERQRPQLKLRALPKAQARVYSATALQAVRQTISGLMAERERITTLPLDRASIKQATERRVTELAKSCSLRIAGERGDTPFDIHLTALSQSDFNVAGGSLSRATPLQALAWFDPQALLARILADIPDLEGMAAADKAGARQRLADELLAAERKEEALIEAAHADGVSIERRVDANPLAILGVTLGAELVAVDDAADVA